MLENVKIMYTEKEIQDRIEELAIEIDRVYDGKEVVAICVLKGAAYFAVDLTKKMQTPIIFEVMQVSSYAGTETTGTISIKKDLDMNIEGKDVIILLDSLTRLSRAYNLTVTPSGRTLSGGLDPSALIMPKKFFGAARNIEDGGSLTILATALVETGSRMDDMIFEEFKGTGNMEVHLDRKLQERRIFPAIDIYKSGTRKEDLLLSSSEREVSFAIRKSMYRDGNIETITENLINMLSKTKNNNDFVNVCLKSDLNKGK